MNLVKNQVQQDDFDFSALDEYLWYKGKVKTTKK